MNSMGYLVHKAADPHKEMSYRYWSYSEGNARNMSGLSCFILSFLLIS